MGNYNFSLDMNADDTNPKLIKQIFSKAEVLEFGAANGRMTKYLTEELQCEVDIVELDQEAGQEAGQYAREVCLGHKEGDIERYFWAEKYSGQKYDFIVFADVLEHLREPQKVLEKCKDFLRETGRILVSIPNIANNAIIYKLLKDEFEYQDTGLLDRTHIHFFTMKSFKRMVLESGFYVVGEDAVYRQIDETEFDVPMGSISKAYREVLGQHKSGLVYQGIFALALTPDAKYLELKYDELNNNLFFTKLYYRSPERQDFSEEYSIVQRRDMSLQRVEFELNCKVADIRLDPMRTPGMIKLNALEIYDENNEIISDIDYVTNGRRIGDNIYVFSVSEPQILISGLDCIVKKIAIDYSCLNATEKDMSYVVDAIIKNDEEKLQLNEDKLQLNKEKLQLNEEKLQLNEEKLQLNEENMRLIGRLEIILNEFEEVRTSFWGKCFYKLKAIKQRLRKKQ